MKTTTTAKTLFIRMDRLGDLILSLPADQLTRHSESSHWFISKGLGFVLDHSMPKRAYSDFGKEFSFQVFKQMLKTLRELNFDAAVIFHAPWWVSLALWMARVPVRIGRYSQWHSFLFFNKGLRQKRSRGEKHELEYNLELTNLLPENLLKQNQQQPPLDQLFLTLQSDLPVLSRFQLSKKSYVVVHPGMGGSALNWPSERYINLVSQLIEITSVVITGTPNDEPFIAPLREPFASYDEVKFLDGQLNGPELIALLSQASVVLAPSTGVAHVAASAGAPTIGLYSPVLAEQALRWGPRGHNISIFEGSLERHPNDPMLAISVVDVVEKMKAFIHEQ